MIIAIIAIVVYWRFMKASAPSRIASATFCIFSDPLLELSTYFEK
jgi:hypothetical protein